MSALDNLITNRESENTYYNSSDLNRVEEAVEEVAAIITKEGYYCTGLPIKKDWSSAVSDNIEDFPIKAQMDRFLWNIDKLQMQYTSIPSVPVPEKMSGLTYIGANNIEEFLKQVPVLVSSMKAAYRRCGTFNCKNI